MAMASKLQIFLFRPNFAISVRNFRNYNKQRDVPKTYVKYLWIAAGGVAAVTCGSLLKMHSNSVHADSLKKKIERNRDKEESVKLTTRERRFIKFASVEYDEQIYMTPRDFLDSVVEQEPRPRLKRKVLTAAEVDKLKDITPPLKRGSMTLFRSLRDKGIVSYTEYLFLLSVLTKPTSGFRIAFNMFDTDGNQRVDKSEFLVIISILAGAFKRNKVDSETQKVLMRLISHEDRQRGLQAIIDKENAKENKSKLTFMERIFSGAWKEKRGQNADDLQECENDENVTANYVDDEEGLQRRHNVNTTLQLHFFGKHGKGGIHFDGFYKFMDNLQTEVLELEFHEFSKGTNVINEVDFAKILLRYTYLATDEYDIFLERLLERVKDEKGITFKDFCDFCRFLNNLDDFTIAMRMYSLADRSISKDEFSRAVKICTGFQLSPHLIDTVFALFDSDGDGLLSHKEFIAIMKDRLHRGFKSVSKAEGWDAFKYCVRQDMKIKQKSSQL